MKLSIRKALLSVIVVPLLSGALYALHIADKGNFHQITEGQAYRSAQLDGEQLKAHIDKYRIKSILNLRGAATREKWYMDEKSISSEYDVKHYDIALSADREPTPEQARKLTEIIRHAPRPILIHCKAGADRTGLVAAMWKTIVEKESRTEAGRQLSVWYGHMPFGSVTAMDNFFEKWFAEMQNTADNLINKAG